MADGDASDLYGFIGPADILNFNKQAYASSPYSMVSQGLSQWQPDYSTWSGTERGVTSFGKSFLAGLMNNYAQQDASAQTSQLMSILPQLNQDPAAVGMPEGMNPALFNQYKAQVMQGQAMEDAVINRKIKLEERMNTVLGNRKELEKRGELDALTKTPGSETIPGTPAFEAAEKKKENALKLDARVTDARDYLKGLGAPLFEGQANLQMMADNFKDSNPITDLTYAIGALKVLDARSVAREGEIDNIQQIVPYLEKQIAGFKNYITPTGAISEQGKLALMKAVKPKLDAMGSQYTTVFDNESKRIKALGGDESMISAPKYNSLDLAQFMAPPVSPEVALQYKQLRAAGKSKEEAGAILGIQP